jgi:predicted nucleic acid-binding Zn ribbon protein
MKFSKNIEDVIADFRGLPRTVTNSSRRDPTPLDNLLVILQEQYKLEKPSPERSLVENWEQVFGSSLAGRCNPVRIKDDRTLIVSVTNPTLRQELQFMKRSVLKKIQALEHCENVTELVIRG